MNCLFWATEISINLSQVLKAEVEKIAELLQNDGKQTPYDQLLLTQNAQVTLLFNSEHN